VEAGNRDVAAVVEVEVRVEAVDLVELVGRSVESVGAALGDLIDDTADGVAEAGIGIEGANGNLRD
jgi:hypothetical protein